MSYPLISVIKPFCFSLFMFFIRLTLIGDAVVASDSEKYLCQLNCLFLSFSRSRRLSSCCIIVASDSEIAFRFLEIGF